jgi:hypothetical protein
MALENMKGRNGLFVCMGCGEGVVQHKTALWFPVAAFHEPSGRLLGYSPHVNVRYLQMNHLKYVCRLRQCVCTEMGSTFVGSYQLSSFVGGCMLTCAARLACVSPMCAR